jgi:16S rRNA (adenine1518-N6/adenine1519-N6)-dimethyltransferase
MNPKYLMDSHELFPKKSLGQNFLHDPNVLEKIVNAAEVAPGYTVLEVGPGTGALTVLLAQRADRLIAVEIDDRLLPILQAQLKDFPNAELIHADILETDVQKLVGNGDYLVCANLPYYITSAILRHLLEVPHKPKRLVLTVQQEVADRLLAQPDDMSLLAVSVQYYGKVKMVSKIGAAAFWPRPDVASAVIRIDVYDTPPVNAPSDELFFKVVRAGFGQKRKQLKNSLGAGLGISHLQAAQLIESAGIEPTRRAETLHLEEWAKLATAVAEKHGAGMIRIPGA